MQPLQLTILLCAVYFSQVTGECGQENCPPVRESHLNIHLIPHTHDDVGWTQTIQEYYDNEVNSILTSTIEALVQNPTYRFIYAEMAFFHKWWSEQNATVKHNVHRLVSEGRLQFVQGGWSMADEATVYYGDEINQLTRGRAFLRETFGKCGIPKVAWQIDTFGHSLDRVDLFIDAGYEGVFFQRIDHKEKQFRRSNKSLELLWETYDGRSLFTHIMYDGYSYPENLCFDPKCARLELPEDEFEDKVKRFQGLIKKYTKSYQFNHIMMPMGSDFVYNQAERNFKAMDRLIDRLNDTKVNGRKINMFYSTPACYLKAINNEVLKTKTLLPTRTGDFFPYADRDHNYWTGYFTSRPAFKAYVRQSANILNVAEQLSLFFPQTLDQRTIDPLRKQVGVVQHHDAITGTEKQFVTEDYIFNLHRVRQPCEHSIAKALSKLAGYREPGIMCDQRNQSLCSVTVTQLPLRFHVTIYNPLGWEISTHWERIPLYLDCQTDDVAIRVKDLTGPRNWEIGSQLVKLTENRTSDKFTGELKGNYELIFNTYGMEQPLPAMGFKTFEISVNKRSSTKSHARTPECVNLNSLGNFLYEVNSGTQAIVIRATDRYTGEQYHIGIEPFYYIGEKRFERKSGAYVFRPAVGETIQRFRKPVFRTTRGHCMNKVEAVYDDWIQLTARQFADGRIEVDWLVRPMPKKFKVNSTEVVIRYTTDPVEALKPCNEGEFYTDTDGRRLIRRLRSEQFDQLSDRIAANYFPVVNRILLKGCRESEHGSELSRQFKKLAMGIYTDRSEGGTSLNRGQLELMIYRRLLVDDSLGVEEALKEDEVNRDGTVGGTHLFVFDDLDTVEAFDRKRATRVVRYPIVLFKDMLKGPISTKVNPSWSALTGPLPDHINLVSLSSWPVTSSDHNSRNKRLLIRLENIAYPNESLHGCHVDLDYLIRDIHVTKLIELSVTADQLKGDQIRMNWNAGSDLAVESEQTNTNNHSSLVCILPGSIRTFLVDYVQL